MDTDFTQEEIVQAVRLIQAERTKLRELLAQVADSVLDKTPDGLSVAYLDRRLLAAIRRHAST